MTLYDQEVPPAERGEKIADAWEEMRQAVVTDVSADPSRFLICERDGGRISLGFAFIPCSGTHLTFTTASGMAWNHDEPGDADEDNDTSQVTGVAWAQSQEQKCTGTTVTLTVSPATLQFDTLGHRAGTTAGDDDEIYFVIPEVLDDLADVDAPDPDESDVLTWYGGKWVARALPEAPDPDAEDPGTSIDTLGDDTEGSETAATDTWTAGGADGLALWVTCRVVYNDAGDEKLYEFRRKLTFDKSGRLYSASGETRIEVEVPEAH